MVCVQGRRCAILLWFAVLGFAATKVAFVADEKSRAQEILRKAEECIRARVSNPEDPKAADIRVIPYENEANTLRGRLKTVVIRSIPAAIKKVPVEEIQMRADGIVIDINQLLQENDLETKACERTTLKAVVSESNLTALFARGRHTKDMKLRARFRDGKVEITGIWKLFMFKGPIQTIGKLVLTRENTLNYEMESLKINNKEAPDSLKAKFMERINPVVEFDELPFKPKISTISFKDDKAYVST